MCSRRRGALFRCRWRGSWCWGCFACDWVRRQRAPFHGCPLLDGAMLLLCGSGLLWLHCCRLLGLGPRVVVGDFYSDLAGVFSSAAERLPNISLTAAGDDDASEVDPRLADQVGLLIVGEDGNLELVVIGGIVDGKPKFLVPRDGRSVGAQLGTPIPQDLPFRRLPAADICGSLLCFLA